MSVTNMICSATCLNHTQRYVTSHDRNHATPRFDFEEFALHFLLPIRAG